MTTTMTTSGTTSGTTRGTPGGTARTTSLSLTLVHTRFHLLQVARIPIALLGAAFFPAVTMVFFIVPNAGDDPRGAAMATASMAVFAAMISNLFGHGVGVAEDRQQPWDSYARTLPVGTAPRFLGRILTGVLMMYLSVLPVVVIAMTLTAASATPVQFLSALGVLLAAALPFALLGLTIGYSLPSKAALAVVQIIFLPMAFAGGLLSDPESAPGFIETIQPFVPTRGAVELMWAALGARSVDPVAVVSLVVWTLLLLATARWAYRRDEGVRYR